MRKLPDKEKLREHIDSGLTPKQIAAIYGVTNEAVRKAALRHDIPWPGAKETKTKDWVPWPIAPAHQHDLVKKRLVLYGKSQQHLALNDREQKFLAEFTEFMDGGNSRGVALSVDYDRREGFLLVPRLPGDRDYVRPPVS